MFDLSIRILYILLKRETKFTELTCIHMAQKVSHNLHWQYVLNKGLHNMADGGCVPYYLLLVVLRHYCLNNQLLQQLFWSISSCALKQKHFFQFYAHGFVTIQQHNNRQKHNYSLYICMIVILTAIFSNWSTKCGWCDTFSNLEISGWSDTCELFYW